MRTQKNVRVSARKNQYGEWTVTTYDENGYKIATYFTNDYEDAILTAAKIIQQLHKRGPKDDRNTDATRD